MKASLYDLDNFSKCQKRRMHNFDTISFVRTDIAERSLLARNVIKGVLGKTLAPVDAANQIKEYFNKNTDIELEKTKQILSDDMIRCINRYLRCEKRQAIIPQHKDLNIWGVEVSVNPDLIFRTQNGLEIVKLYYKRPSVKNTGSSSKKTITTDESKALYALLQYGRSLIAPGQTAKITASYYYLRKKNDSTAKNIFDPDFFDEKGKNIVSISDIYTSGNNTLTAHDLEMKTAFDEFSKGVQMECDEEKCKGCELYATCTFKKAPKVLKMTETEKKVMSSVSASPSQKAAIDFEKGVTRINAGAGAGKTFTIAMRVVELLKKGYEPKEIALFTFTNTGAKEMRDRIQLFNDSFGTGDDISEMTISTFNSFGDTLIQKYYPLLGYQKVPMLIDEIERSKIILDMLKDKDIDGLDFRNYNMNTKDVKGVLHVAKHIFAIMKSNNLDETQVDEIKNKLGKGYQIFCSYQALTTLAGLYPEYVYKLWQEGLYEFSDQELLTFRIYALHPTAFAELGFKHIIIDEYQDSSLIQLNMIKLMMNTPYFTSLMVVGDDSQAIFGFRDTSPDFIINFFNYIGVAGQDFYLLDNYRSTANIIDFANKLNALNQNRVIKDLKAMKPAGKPVIARMFDKKAEEYEYIVDSIEQKIKAGEKPENIAFIASKMAELQKMADLLTKRGIPSVLLNPEKYLDNNKVKAALSLLKAYCNPVLTTEILTYLNCLNDGDILKYSDSDIKLMINDLQSELSGIKLLKETEKKEEIFKLLGDLLYEEDEVYEKFLGNLKAKSVSLSHMIDYANDFEKFGENEGVRRTSNYPGVVLTTAHSSKGLEWKIVYNSITNYEKPSLRKIADVEETRRLFFVSATRAKEELIITSQKIAYGNKNNDCEVYNRFIYEAYNILGLAATAN